MKYWIDIKRTGTRHDFKQLANIEAALKILDHGAVILDNSIPGAGYDLRLTILFPGEFSVKILAPDLPEGQNRWEFTDYEIFDPRYSREDREQRCKELVRLGIIKLVGNYLHLAPPWGILSGVRPTKIFHHYRDQGFSTVETIDKLLNIYGLAEAKARLLAEIGEKQELNFTTGRSVSIYIGIPFCPTRCRYCSFSAVPLGTHGHLVKSFINSLLQEIEATGNLIRESGLTIDAIYVGGGTPTAIDDQSFHTVLESLTRNFNIAATPKTEFTVEAGRPETITPAKLKIMSGFGVNRVSVNPQTMNPATLERIGRNHTVADIYEAVNLVKNYSQFSLNMDLILGLPGETGMNFSDSLAKVIELEPQNITIHTLAPKRASEWRKEFNTLQLPAEEDLREAADEALAGLKSIHYDPYYLYRQRFILADLENIGFTKPGYENRYNIHMMEERQTVFGLGGGAVTKWVVGPDFRVFRYQNPKCPATYSGRVMESIVKKAQRTRILLG